ncbi:MAG: methylthioadenosine phosphorylase [Desulfobacteraceae bacterium 4572_88]|nr:MAG: methylthioadenosine phosphorylase [Desulfobacteraceae bacterium 4572_88]RLC14008.1 MAG: S-methyl-5'-thioadenosine phosphorylase [Deltaproteobacteria bacterium]
MKVGIIGGSGLDDPQILQDAKEISADTPYGKPSSVLTEGNINGVNTVLLTRHGKRHELSPTQVNYRANIHALKDQGVTHILATTACGSLREDIDRGDFVILDQFIDFTKFRKNTFHESFENGIEHPTVADPFDVKLRQVLYETSVELGFRTHEQGTVVTIEGPRFSTRAESKMFRIWGADVINMSVATEAILANEAGIPYGVVAMSTDYDCWKADEEIVSWQEILAVFERNAEKVTQLLIHAVSKIR